MNQHLKQSLTTTIIGKKVLLVDDIADTGESLKLAKTTSARRCQRNQNSHPLQKTPIHYNP